MFANETNIHRFSPLVPSSYEKLLLHTMNFTDFLRIKRRFPINVFHFRFSFINNRFLTFCSPQIILFFPFLAKFRRKYRCKLKFKELSLLLEQIHHRYKRSYFHSTNCNAAIFFLVFSFSS